MKKVTYNTIAKELNISAVAVCKAINNHSGVGAELKKKILTTAAEMGYIPSKKHLQIGGEFCYAVQGKYYTLPFDQFYTTIFHYLSIECAQNYSELKLLILSKSVKESIASLIDFIKKHKKTLKGFFIGSETSPKVIEFIKSSGLPYLYMDYYIPTQKGNYIFQDNFNASYLITKYLINQGHTNIGFIGDVRNSNSVADRYFGYRKALFQSGIKANNAWFINIDIEKHNDISWAPQELPTAFLCHCDMAAQRLYLLLKFRNISIPEDISVASFDNTTICEELNPKLTSVGIDRELFAKKGFQTMVDILNRNEHYTVPISSCITERDSVKRILP